MSFKLEVIADDSGKWVGNSVALATEEEAKSYANNMRCRWTLVRATRVVTSDEAVNYEFTTGGLERLG